MPERVYTHLSKATAGVHTTWTLTGPSIFAPEGFQGPFYAALRPVTLHWSGVLTQEAKAAFPWEPMTSAFTPVDASDPLNGIVAGTSTDDPVMPFVEFTSRAHWPPYGKDSALAHWAARHQISAYLVARLIAQRGTQGLYAMQHILLDAVAAWERDIDAAVSGVLRGGV